MKAVKFFVLIVVAWMVGALLTKGAISMLGLDRKHITITIEQKSDAVVIPQPTQRWRI